MSEPSAAPTPSFATVDQLNQLEKGIGQSIGQLGQVFEQALEKASRKETLPIPTPTSYRPTKEALEKAYVEGTIHEELGRMVETERELVKRELRAEFQQAMGKGQAAISQLTAQAVRSQMPHFDRFKTEIEQTLSVLPEESRMNPDTWKSVHDYVVGKNVGKLIEETKEEAIRGNRSSPNLPGSTRGGPSKPGLPSVEEALGPEAAKTLDMRGLTPDEMAKKLRYANWEDYYNKRVKPAQELRNRGRK